MVVGIEGPEDSGKSSAAQWVAERLGYLHIDSGSLYRALTAAALRGNAPPEDWSPERLLRDAPRVTLGAEKHAFHALIDGQRVEEEIRGGDVTANVSLVAKMQAVRSWVNASVREAARWHDVVVDGRDMGTAVFPDAPLKVFLVADPWEPAPPRLVHRFGRRPPHDDGSAATFLLLPRD